MAEQRVFITGVGLVGALALDAPTHFQRWLAGESGVTIADNIPYKDLPYQLEARVSGFKRRANVTNRMQRKLLSNAAGYAVGAAGEALADAGLAADEARRAATGLYIGSISLDIDPDLFIPPLKASLDRNNEFDISLFATRGMRLLDPLFLVKALPNAGVCGISVQHQVLGPNTNITNGPTSGLQAVATAAAAIQRGETDRALAGGYDTLLGMDCVAEHHIAGRLSAESNEPGRACRPFDRARDGYALGEAAAVVLLEGEASVAERGVKPYAEITGTALTSDAAPLATGSQAGDEAFYQAGRQALAEAGVTAADLDALFGDGLGTRDDDAREARAAARLLNGTAVPFTAVTAAAGFTGAASGAVSLIHALLAMRQSIMPPLFNCDEPDDEAVHFLRAPEERRLQNVLVWNSERGLKNVALCLSRPA